MKKSIEMSDDLRQQIDAMITERIVTLYRAMVRRGQIPQVEETGPTAIPLSSDCNRSANTHSDDRPEGLPLLHSEPLGSGSGERVHA